MRPIDKWTNMTKLVEICNVVDRGTPKCTKARTLARASELEILS
jgi:hypothetical protein